MADLDEMSESEGELMSYLELDQQAHAELEEAVSADDLDAFPIAEIAEIGQVAETLRDEQPDDQQQTPNGDVQPDLNPNGNNDQSQLEFLPVSYNGLHAVEQEIHTIMQTQRFADPQRGHNPDDQLPDYNSNTDYVRQQLYADTGSVESENQIMQSEQPNDDQQQIHDLFDQSNPNLNVDDDQLEMPFLDRQIPSPVAAANQQQQAQNAILQADFNPDVNNVQQSFPAPNNVTTAPEVTAWRHQHKAEGNNVIPASSQSHLLNSSSTLNGSNLALQNFCFQQQPLLNFIPMSAQGASSSNAQNNEQGPSNSYLANTNPIVQSSTTSSSMENGSVKEPIVVDQQNSTPSTTKKMPKKRAPSLQKNSTSVKISKTTESSSAALEGQPQAHGNNVPNVASLSSQQQQRVFEFEAPASKPFNDNELARIRATQDRFRLRGPSTSGCVNTNYFDHQMNSFSTPLMENDSAQMETMDADQLKNAESTLSLSMESTTSISSSPDFSQSNKLICCLCDKDVPGNWKQLSSCLHVFHQECSEDPLNLGKKCSHCEKINEQSGHCRSCNKEEDQDVLYKTRYGTTGVCEACKLKFYRLSNKPRNDLECGEGCEQIESYEDYKGKKYCCKWKYFIRLGFKWNEDKRNKQQNQWPECDKTCDPNVANNIKEELELLYEGKMCCLLASFKLFGFDRKPVKKENKPRKRKVKLPIQQKPIRARTTKPKQTVKQPKQPIRKPVKQQKQQEILTQKSTNFAHTLTELNTKMNDLSIGKNSLTVDFHGITTNAITIVQTDVKNTDHNVKVEDNKLLWFDLSGVKQMLTPHANKKLLVINIIGKYKYITRNFILRYLKWLKQGKHGDWRVMDGPLPDKSKLIPITEGINIWPELFVVDDGTVLLLVETQRMYDKKANEKDQLFVFSLLMASTTILNVPGLPELRSHMILDFLLEYSIMYKKPSEFLQKMLILIRNWDDSSFNKTANGPLPEKWKNVMDVFKMFGFSLMPSHAITVADSRKFQGERKFDLCDISNDFLTYIPVLVENVLGSDEISSNLGRGQPVKCGVWLEEMEMYAEKFGNDDGYLYASLFENIYRMNMEHEYENNIAQNCLKKFSELQQLIVPTKLTNFAELDIAMKQLNMSSLDFHEFQKQITKIMNEYASKKPYLQMPQKLTDSTKQSKEKQAGGFKLFNSMIFRFVKWQKNLSEK